MPGPRLDRAISHRNKRNRCRPAWRPGDPDRLRATDLARCAAATFPDLKIVAAHFGYPWHLELLAMALHKTNISIDISGSAPRYIPTEVIRDMKGRLQDQFLFGSDSPFIQPQRCLDEGRVAAEQELILEPALHVAYDLGRDVARRRPGDVDGDVGLVQGHREQLQVPRVAEMRGDDFEVGKGGRGASSQIGRAKSIRIPWPPGWPAPIPLVPV